MSFLPITWKFTPPPTVAPAPPKPTSAPKLTTGLGGTSGAAKLIGRLNDLRDTATYLEQIITERTKNIAVAIADPELQTSVARLYGVDTPVTGISVPMYNRMLDTTSGISRAELALKETGSPLLVSPMQKADLIRATGAFEDAMIDSGTFENQLPGVLRQLKGDRIVYDQMSESIKQYPILSGSQTGDIGSLLNVTVGPAPTGPDQVALAFDPTPVQVLNQFSVIANANTPDNIALSSSTDAANQTGNPQAVPGDVDPDTQTNVNERLDAIEKVYAGIYNLTAASDAVYFDIQSIASKYFYQPLNQLQHALDMIAMLRTLFVKPSLKTIKAGLTAIVFPILLSEISALNFLMDRLISKAVNPVLDLVFSLNRTFSEIAKVSTDVAYMADGGLTGMVRSRITGNFKMPPRKNIAALDTIPAGLKALGTNLSWAVLEGQRKRAQAEHSMMALFDRKINGDGKRVDVLKTLRQLDALTDITKSFIQVKQNGSISAQLNNPVDAFTSQTRSLIQGGGSLNTLPPPPNVASVLDRGTGVHP